MAKRRETLLGYAPVDSGQLLIVDPCYLAEWKHGEFGDMGTHYGKACEITTGNEQQGGELLVCGVAGNGVVFVSGYGDGRYPVTAKYDKHGRIKSVIVHLG